ncbi:MAG TPA: nucleotide sugar dehydrogenase [Candidatus Acidoferrales bacterium]|nr:nucleotide sugar dehydrogenase [Candidatus Acidoferrales bacterium]
MSIAIQQPPISLEPGEISVRIRTGALTVGVVGLGWMGLPTACLFADAGARVIGADMNPKIVERVSKGDPPLEEPGLSALLKKGIRSGKITATTSTEEAAANADIIFIVVPTMIDRQKRADYSAVEDACASLGKTLKNGSLVIFESTCGPGVTERVVKATLEKYSGLVAGQGFGLAYSPIRAMGGRALQDMQTYSKIVGAIDARSLEAACATLSVIVKGELIRVRDIRTAELSKLFETIYRDVNIGLANEFALLCEDLGVDYLETVKAANSQPYSHLHSTGGGVGGHCLPVYPYLLASEAYALDAKLKLVLDGRKINDFMPRHVAKLASDGMRVSGKSIKRARVVVLGISYRPNVKEIRFSPSLELIGILKKRGARVVAFDPLFNAAELESLGIVSEPTLRKAVEKADCVILTIGHDEFKKMDTIELAAHMSKKGLVVDCTGLLDPASVEKSGLVYRGVGRGLWTR